MVIPIFFNITNKIYIAGSGEGIVTVRGAPASRSVYLMDAETLAVIRVVKSLRNGRYIFMGLNPSKEYMVMVRDFKREFEPFAWDYVKPADDLDMVKLKAIV